MFSVRWMFTLVVWCGTLFFSHNAFYSTLLAAIVDLITVVALTRMVKGVIVEKEKDNSKRDIKGILLKCLPLCISCFTAIYLPNAAKYAIDACLSDSD